MNRQKLHSRSRIFAKTVSALSPVLARKSHRPFRHDGYLLRSRLTRRGFQSGKRRFFFPAALLIELLPVRIVTLYPSLSPPSLRPATFRSFEHLLHANVSARCHEYHTSGFWIWNSSEFGREGALSRSNLMFFIFSARDAHRVDVGTVIVTQTNCGIIPSLSRLWGKSAN